MEEANLKKRVEELEQENAYLKSLLVQAGISFDIPEVGKEKTDILETAQGKGILPVEITHEHARRFFSYFWGRMDVFSKRHQNKTTGKTGYYPQCNNFFRKGVCPKETGAKIRCKECEHREWTELEAGHIEAHLRGKKLDGSDVVGVYPLFPDGTCRFLVFDFDNHEGGAESKDFANIDDSWIEEVEAVRMICKTNGIPCLVERSRSGRGAHIWIFFDSQISAELVRRFGVALLDKGAESVNLKSFRYYDRMLPAQSQLSAGEVGNLIALPLQGQALKKGNSAFVDENWNAYSNQWKVLLSVKRLSGKNLEQFLLDWHASSKGDGQELFMNDDTKPWERTDRFQKEDVSGELQVVLSNRIYISTENLKPRIQNQIRKLAAFSNPVFYKNTAIGLSNYAQSRFIYLGEDENGYICIPRGLQDTLNAKCMESGIGIRIEDRRNTGRPIHVEFKGELREKQKIAMKKLLNYDYGILSAATAFGKTVTCSGIIAEKKVSTLILLESSALVEQWEKALKKFLVLDERLPEYRTKTGRIKQRKDLIGVIHGAKDTSTGIIDIAMAGSLFKKGEAHPRLKEYGLVLVDECHHSASDTISAVLKEVEAKYVYGVTATPFRGDHLEKICFMLLGPVRFRYTAKERAAEQGISHLVIPRFTRTVCPHGGSKLHISEAYALIQKNTVRNEQILEDVRNCIKDGRTPVVLSRYTNQAKVLYEQAKEYADHVFLFIGTIAKKEKDELMFQMNSVPENESMLLIGTGQMIGEGFDMPRLDTLIMATPISGKGLVEQYAGRLDRDYPGKERVLIYDYVDMHIPVFDRMYAKRLKAYKTIGYQLYEEEISGIPVSNAIFDSETYVTVYEKDLKEAKKEIVISSPTLGRAKVFSMIRILKERQEAGVRITIVTWHPDAYRYGRDEHRIELMEELNNTGFHLELMENNCGHYAVIDQELVWYGNINLLSKEDLDEHIMRVSGKEIAAELLEVTFQKGNSLLAYEWPPGNKNE